MILLKETGGDTLQGAIDGVNTAFVCSFDFQADTVQIYVNGRLKLKDWDDGFWVQPPRTVILKEAPLTGDSLEIEYQSPTKTGGGAEGGRPSPPVVETFVSTVAAGEDRPSQEAVILEPAMTSQGQPIPVTLAEDVRPAMLKPEEIS